MPRTAAHLAACRIIVAVALLVAGVPAAADDITASLPAGGLRLPETVGLHLAEREVFVSREEIRITHLLENHTEQEMNLLLAFPLPAIDLGRAADVPITPPAADPVNFAGFEAKVDGQPLRPQVELRAFRNGIDVSELLIRYGVPLSRFDARLYPTLASLAPPARAELTAMTLAEWDTADGVRPLWTTRTTFFWPQKIPARGEVRIELRFSPVVGRVLITDRSLAESPLVRRHCIDESFLEAAHQRLETDPGTGVRAFRIRHAFDGQPGHAIPADRFRLIIDKGSPRALLAVCGRGLMKAETTQISLERRNFTPTGEIDILILDEEEAR